MDTAPPPADPYASLKAAGAALLATGQVAPSAAALAAATAPAPAPEAPADVLDMIRSGVARAPLAPDDALEAMMTPATGAPAPAAFAAPGTVGTPAIPAAAPVAEPALATAAPELPAFDPDRSRSRTVPLSWPVTYGGFRYEAIVVTRPTAREVGDFFERLSAELKADPTALVRFPVYKDTMGRPVPGIVMDALDDDDQQDLLEHVSSFLPKRLRPELEPTQASDASSSLGAGDATAPRFGR